MKLRSLPSLFSLPARIGFRDHVIGAALAIGYVAWLLATARTLGFARDEGFYFRAATEYARWFQHLAEDAREAVQRGAIDGAWSNNHEHPAFMKTLFAFSWMLFHEKWEVFEDASTAFRFPGMLMGGLTVWVTYLFGARAWSRRAGLVAALLFALMPRVFYHAHLACFDMGIVGMWTLAIYVYWRSLQSRHVMAWALAAGVVYGLTLETKHNAWILPAVFLPHALFVYRHAIRRQLRLGRLPIPLSLLSMATIGPAVFIACWPWLWNDTLPRIQEYVNFHLNHEYYNMEFLGVNYFGPPSPRGYMPVMILATVPTVTIVLFAIGGADRLVANGRRLYAWGRAVVGRWRPSARPSEALLRELPPPDRGETDLLLALAFFAAIGPFFLAKTPIFGGTKHWMPAYPFLALFAGRGFDVVAAAMRRALAWLDATKLQLLERGLGVFVLMAPLAVTAHSHPFGLSSYVPFVGGTAGGATLGLNRQFWGFTTQSANAEYLEANAPRGASVFIHDTAWESWQRMLDEGRVRPDLRGVGSVGEGQLALIQHELHMSEVDYQIWVAYGTDAPVYVVSHDGVPIVSIYKKP